MLPEAFAALFSRIVSFSVALYSFTYFSARLKTSFLLARRSPDSFFFASARFAASSLRLALFFSTDSGTTGPGIFQSHASVSPQADAVVGCEAIDWRSACYHTVVAPAI